MGYPIVSLRRHTQDLHWYLRRIEETLIRTVARWDIAADRNPGLTGVWTRGRKLASIGVHARDWVTWHGFALNVSTDLRYFELIVPCGIDGVVMTSMARECGRDNLSTDDVASAAAEELAAVFSLTAMEQSRGDIEDRIAATR